MGFDRTIYVCPKCGRMLTGAIAYRKHVNSNKCKPPKDSKDAPVNALFYGIQKV